MTWLVFRVSAGVRNQPSSILIMKKLHRKAFDESHEIFLV